MDSKDLNIDRELDRGNPIFDEEKVNKCEYCGNTDDEVQMDKFNDDIYVCKDCQQKISNTVSNKFYNFLQTLSQVEFKLLIEHLMSIDVKEEYTE